jgi:hypothetical protein
MKKINLALAMVLGLSVLLTVAAKAGEAPDGFANIPWGANSNQVDQTMNTQEFRKIGACPFNPAPDGSTCMEYRGGRLAGVAGNLYLWFLNDTFFHGLFAFHKEDGGDAARSAYARISPIIQSKYGPPTTSQNYGQEEGSYNAWDGLRAGSDSISITIYYSAILSRCGSSFCSSNFGVEYFNKSLQGRLLAGGNKSGL